MPEPTPVRAAGVVVFRTGHQVLLVHRPRYDDWSFPKGKLDPGEHAVVAAVREVAEETGLHVRLARPLSSQRYDVGPEAGRRPKTVDYWVGRAVGDGDVSGYQPNHEIDQVAWVPQDEARERLTYEHDRQTLAEAVRVRPRTVAVVVVRHAEARSRKAWRGDDRARPLLVRGHLRAQRLVPLLAAYDVASVLTSSSLRCVQTVAPYGEVAGLDLRTSDALSEEDATRGGVRRCVDELVEEAVERERGLALCSHRPVLPHVFDALGLEDPHLEPGEMLVAHLRKGRVRAVERHHTG